VFTDLLIVPFELLREYGFIAKAIVDTFITEDAPPRLALGLDV
jgi:hypothetical protein